MLQKLLQRIIGHRHWWRDTKFNELNEIYVAMLVRGLSLSMVGLFVPVYMIKLGYDLSAFLLLQVWYFYVRVVMDFVAARLVAKFGPKHVMVFGQILFSCASLLFLTLEHHHWPLWLLGAVWGASQSCFFISFDVDFSKIKHSRHSGKELSYVEIMGKVGAVLGPLIGGVIGFFAAPHYIFAFSTVLLILGLSPLFKTREPVRPNQKLDYRGFVADHLKPMITPFLAVNVENTLSVMMWPIFLTLFVLPGKTIFVKIGVLASVSVILAIFSAHAFGKLIDAGRGRKVLRISVAINTLLHLLRPLVGSYPVAFGVNSANEIATLGYRLPFFKAYYDQADVYPGYRIVFISVMESLASLAKALVYTMLLMISWSVQPKVTLVIAFLIAALSSTLIAKEKFKSLDA